MLGRRRNPTDLSSVRRSRAGCTGAITKALDRFRAINTSTPEDVALINSKEVERILTSIIKTETSFMQSLEEAQAFIPEDSEDAFQAEEEHAADTFSASISATRDLGEQLLCYKSVLNGLANFTSDLDAIQQTLSSKPESNQVSALQDLKALFSSLRSQWQTANLPRDHPIKAELDSCTKVLATLAADVTAASDKSDTSSVSSSASSTPASPCFIWGKNDLPTIQVPKFSGDIMDWSSYWASFKSTIEDRKELSNTQRLHYLRESITDPELQLLLHSPAETSDFYEEVVEELKERFEKTREIHKLLTRTLVDLSSPKQTRSDLRKLVDLVKRTINSLKATKQYDVDSFLSSLVFSVLPSRLQTSWSQQTKKEKKVPPISQLLTFLREHAETLPASGATPPATPSEHPSKKAPPKKADRKPDHSKPRGIHSVAPTNNYKWDCILCKPEKHPLHICPKWATLNVNQRLGHIQSKALCSNCLAAGHLTSACKSTYRCRECSQPHHTSIHQQQAATTPVNSSSTKSSQVPDALMTTAQVLLVGPRGQEVKARALIDSGAGLSLISNRVAHLLDLPLEPTRLQLSVAQGEQSKPIKHLTHLHLSPLQNRALKIPCRAAVAPTVTCDLPPQAVEQVLDLPHIMGLQLADPDYHIPGRIDILLGAEMAPKVMLKALLRDGLPSQPTAQATHFGWVVSGPVKRKNPYAEISPSSFHQTPIFQTNSQLEPLIKQFWESEEPEPEEAPHSTVESQVEEHFQQTITYLPEEKRYEVTLPKLPTIDNLGESKPQALTRFLSNEKSILKKNVWEPFQQVMREYFNLNHAEEVPATELSKRPQFYLPMHSVYKSSSTSTKIRVVFDGSAATSTGLSLNKALMVGPTIQPTLSTILMQFRLYPVALNSDIRKMYREVLLSSEDRDLHRFLWRDSPQDPVKDFRMTRVTFGVSASPYLAVKTLQQTAADHGEEYPRATHHIKHSFYVDDFLGGASTVQEAVDLYKDLRTVLSKGSFSLCKWRSSSQAVLQHIPAELQETQLVKDATSPLLTTSSSKALGLQWNSRLDTMSPSINVPPTYRPTKRGLISDVARTYDVLGWIAPAVLSMKLLYQKLWKTGQGWDDQVPPDLLALHKQWRSELPELTARQLPRCYSSPSHHLKHQELHCFCDASKSAFGAVLYCRTTYHDHPPTVVLITAKTKVAKLDPPTVPRLELCGAKLLTTILLNTANILNIPVKDWHCWSDSAIILAWLDGRPRSLPVFVQNRVHFILQHTKPSCWHHVPTSQNPADCASRGVMPQELLHHSLWWEGPPWLSLDPVIMPKQPLRKELLDPPPAVNVISQQSTLAEDICKNSATYLLTVSNTAWCLRFCSILLHRRIPPAPPDPHFQPEVSTATQSPVTHLTLTGAERRSAELWLLKQSQARLFSKERLAILHKRPISKSSRLIALHPLLDHDGLLRVGGRLDNSSLSRSQMHPIIADARDPLIQQYFEHLHLNLCHCGPSLLLCAAGAKLHVLSARRLSAQSALLAEEDSPTCSTN